MKIYDIIKSQKLDIIKSQKLAPCNVDTSVLPIDPRTHKQNTQLQNDDS